MNGFVGRLSFQRLRLSRAVLWAYVLVLFAVSVHEPFHENQYFALSQTGTISQSGEIGYVHHDSHDCLLCQFAQQSKTIQPFIEPFCFDWSYEPAVWFEPFHLNKTCPSKRLPRAPPRSIV